MMTREADGRRDAMHKQQQEQEQDKNHRDKHSQMINTPQGQGEAKAGSLPHLLVVMGEDVAGRDPRHETAVPRDRAPPLHLAPHLIPAHRTTHDHHAPPRATTRHQRSGTLVGA
eukprot:COSAG02_NODE_5103_length_4628_cov_3.366085_5_plen_114_part_00